MRDGHQILPGALGEGLPPLARQHPGLVHQPPVVVGPPQTGMVPQGGRPGKADRGDLRDPEKVHVSLEGPSDPENWEQEEDVLDTWASSWLWPFATLGWPDQAAMDQAGFDFFYPTATLVTGPDIIFSGWRG